MANIVITSKGTNGIYVDFGVYASSDLDSPQGFNAVYMQNIWDDGTGVEVVMDGRNPQHWKFCHTLTIGYMIIDSIDGVAPTSAADLVDKLTALI